MIKISKIFEPFEDWSEGEETFFGLCVKDGEIYKPKDDDYYEEDGVQEFHISLDGPEDIWRIDYTESTAGGPEVYWGSIPNRDFFIKLMKNIVGGVDIEQLIQPILKNELSKKDGYNEEEEKIKLGILALRFYDIKYEKDDEGDIYLIGYDSYNHQWRLPNYFNLLSDLEENLFGDGWVKYIDILKDLNNNPDLKYASDSTNLNRAKGILKRFPEQIEENRIKREEFWKNRKFDEDDLKCFNIASKQVAEVLKDA